MTFESTRLLLRPLREEDICFLSGLYESPLPVEKAEQMYRVLASSDECHLVIEDREKGICTGLIGLQEDTDGLILGYRIAPAYRNMHYAMDAVYLLIRQLTSACGVRKITAHVQPDNAVSIRVLTHNGFEKTGENDQCLTFIYRAKQTEQDTVQPESGLEVIYAAGGCFWGTEKVFRMLDGVKETSVGYANGITEHPAYEDVCRGDTGYRETVRIVYDPYITPLEIIAEAFFLCVDPTVRNRQGNDIGTQYQTGIYYVNEDQKAVLEEIFEKERMKHKRFFVELEPLKVFYTAEEYHQKYLDKFPGGYCHITKIELEEVRKLNSRGKKS